MTTPMAFNIQIGSTTSGMAAGGTGAGREFFFGGMALDLQ